MADYSVSARIGIDASGLISGLSAAGAAVSNFASVTKSKIDSSLSSVEKHSAAWNKVGSTLTTAGAAAAVGLGSMAKAAMDWEQQFTGVVKTTGVTGKAMNQLESELRSMAKTMPATHKEIAGVAEAAGQLGVKTPDIARFTRTMVMMGASTNLSSEQAATGIAQFMNIMGTVPSKVGNVASTIVALGNAGASTEAQILDMGQRIAGAGNQVKMSEAGVLAYANALASVGINAEAGGTAMSKVLIKLDQGAREGGKSLETLNRVAGIDFRKAFQEDAAGATHELIKGLGRIQASGGDVAGVLKEMGISGQYERDAMMRLAGATLEAGAAQDVLGDSLKVGNEAIQSQSALLDEYGRFANTTESKAKIAWNQIKDAAITAGKTMLPMVAEVAKTVSGLADSFSKLSPDQIKFGVTAAGFVSGFALIAGGAIKTVTALADLNASIKELGGKGIGGLTKAAGIASAALVALAAVRWVNSNFQKGVDDTRLSIEEMGNTANLVAKGDMSLMDAELGKINSTVKGTGEAFQQLHSANGGFNGFMRSIGDAGANLIGFKSSFQEIEEVIGKFDTKLKDMDLSSAQAAFRNLAEENKRWGISVEETASRLPQYKAKLDGILESLGGVKISNQEYVDWMGGKVPDAVAKAAEGNEEVKRSLVDVGNQAGSTGKSMKDLAEEFERTAESAQRAGNKLLALSDAEIGVEAAIDSLTDSLKEHGKTLDINTAAGRANQKAINELAGESQKYIEQLAKQGFSEEEQTAKTKKAREELEAKLKLLGKSPEEIKAYTDAIFQTIQPMESAAKQADSTAESFKVMNDELSKVPPETKITVKGDGIDLAKASLTDVRKQLDDMPLSRLIKVTMPNGEVLVTTVGELKMQLDKGARAADGMQDSAKKLNEELGKLKPETKVSVKGEGIDMVAQSLHDVRGQLEKMPPETPVEVTLPNGEHVITTVGKLRDEIKLIDPEKKVTFSTPGLEQSLFPLGQFTKALKDTPPDKMVKFSAPGVDDVNVQAGKLRDVVGAIDPTKVISITMPNGQVVTAEAGVVKDAIDGVPNDKPITITASTNAKEVATDAQTTVDGVTGVERDITFNTNAPTTAGIANGALGSIAAGFAQMWADMNNTQNTTGTTVEGNTTGWAGRIRGAFSDLKGQASQQWSSMWSEVSGTGTARGGEVETNTGGWRGRIHGIFSDLRGKAHGTWSGMWSEVSGTGSARRGEIESSTTGWRGRVEGIFSTLRGNLSGTWTSMWSGLRGTTESMASTISGRISGLMGSLTSAFSSGVGSIGRAWSGVTPAAAGPVRTIIRDVYNNGIREGFNKVAGLFNMGGLPSMAINFARGGIMPGYTPGRDIFDFYDPKHNIRLGLSGGEAILRPEVARLLGAAGVDTINRAAMRGGQRGAAKALAGISGHFHFAKGGIMPERHNFAVGGIVNFNGVAMDAASAALLHAAQRLAGVVFAATQGSFRPATSYSGTTHTGAGAIDIAYPSLRQVVALRSVGSAAWDRTGKGNWIPHIHAIFPVPGLSGSAAAQYADYLRGGDGLGGADNGPRGLAGKISSELLDSLSKLGDSAMDFFTNPKQGIKNLLQGALDKLSAVTGTQWGRVMAEIPKKLVNDIAEKAATMLPGFAGGGYTGTWGRSKADDIPARLSIKEYVQPEESTEYYGLGVMEAMRRRLIPKEIFSPYGFAEGGTLADQISRPVSYAFNAEPGYWGPKPQGAPVTITINNPVAETSTETLRNRASTLSALAVL